MTFLVWCQFALVCLLGAMSPGPSLALIIYNSINFNRISGVIAAIAHGLGICLYATITFILLEFILKNSEAVFFIIQILGSVFLLILGIRFFLMKNNERTESTNGVKSNSFIQGFVIAIINPKILVWFVAIYSQFITIDASNNIKLILILTPSIIDAIWYSLIAILVTSYGLKELLIHNKKTINKIIGSLLILISLSLIYSLFFL